MTAKQRIALAEREITRLYRTTLEKIRADLGKIYEKYAKGGKLTRAEMTKYNRLSNLEAQLLEDMSPALRESAGTVKKLQKAAYREEFFRNSQRIDKLVGRELRWGLLPPDLIKQAVDNMFVKIAIQGTSQASRLAIRRSIAQGLTQGLSYENMVKLIKDKVVRDAQHKYLTIARTEGNRAVVKAQLDNADRAEDMLGEGAIERVWDASLDTRVRNSHAKLDGKRANHDKETGQYFWFTDVGRVAGPMQSGVPSFDINCRCRVIEELSETFKKEYDIDDN